MHTRLRPWIMPGLCLVAFGLRATGLDCQSLWRDEVDALRFASRPLGDLLRMFTAPGENGPLYYLLLRHWLELVGDSEYALRFPSVLCGVLAVPVVYRLGRRLFPSTPAVPLVGALLAAWSPYLVWYSQEGKMYAFVVLLVLLSMERFLAALTTGGWGRWLSYVLVTSAAFYVHLLSVLIIPVQAGAFFLMDRELRRARWKPWAASLAALTLPYLPLLAWQLPLLLRPAQTGFAFVPLPQMVLSLLTAYSLGVASPIGPWILGLYAALLLSGVWAGIQGRLELASVGILLLWLLLPVLGLFLISFNRPLYTARYLIFLLPAYLLLLAVGVVAVGSRARVAAAILLAALLAIGGWGLWLQATTPIKADLRGATRYVSSRWKPGDLVLFQIPYGRYSFDYYVHHQAGAPSLDAGSDSLAQGEYSVFIPFLARSGPSPYRWAEGLYTNAGMDPSEVDRRMTELTTGSRVIWLVATEVPLWDQRGLVQAWLNQHAALVEDAQFVRVGVYRYELP